MIARHAGADRIELNLALELDGLTPSPGLMRRVVDQLEIPVIAMARPCAGGFHYSDDQWATLREDAAWLIHHGAAGVAFGAIQADGQIDVDRCRQLRDLVGEKELVFHKAFDIALDRVAALEHLIVAGVDRVMTSGLAATARDGAFRIASIVRQSQNRIEILPAGGISSHNAKRLVCQTGCRQIHGSFRHSAAGNLEQEIRDVISCLNQPSADL